MGVFHNDNSPNCQKRMLDTGPVMETPVSAPELSPRAMLVELKKSGSSFQQEKAPVELKTAAFCISDVSLQCLVHPLQF